MKASQRQLGSTRQWRGGGQQDDAGCAEQLQRAAYLTVTMAGVLALTLRLALVVWVLLLAVRHCEVNALLMSMQRCGVEMRMRMQVSKVKGFGASTGEGEEAT